MFLHLPTGVTCNFDLNRFVLPNNIEEPPTGYPEATTISWPAEMMYPSRPVTVYKHKPVVL